MGLGAVAPAFAALLDRYVLDRFGGPGTLESGQPPGVGAPAEHRAGGRRGAGRGQRLGGLDRGGDGRPGRPRGRRRPEPPEPRSGRGRPPEPAARSPLPRRSGGTSCRSASGDASSSSSPSPGAAGSASGSRRMDNLEYHALLRLPPAAARKALGEGAPPEAAARLGRARRRGGGRPARRPGRPRPGRDRRRVRGGRRRRRPAGGDPRLDAQGLAAAVRRGSAEPRRPADRGAAGRAPAASWACRRATSGRRFPRTAPKRGTCAA